MRLKRIKVVVPELVELLGYDFSVPEYECTCGMEVVADLAGHKNLNTTKDNYGNYNRNKAREAHRKFVTG